MTWEPEENFVAPELLESFWEEVGMEPDDLAVRVTVKPSEDWIGEWHNCSCFYSKEG